MRMASSEAPVDMAPAALDATRRFVRVSRERADGFIEFEFAIGEPELFAELILPAEAFADFCSANRVESLPAAADAGDEGRDDWNWRLADATGTRFR